MITDRCVIDHHAPGQHIGMFAYGHASGAAYRRSYENVISENAVVADQCLGADHAMVAYRHIHPDTYTIHDDNALSQFGVPGHALVRVNSIHETKIRGQGSNL